MNDAELYALAAKWATYPDEIPRLVEAYRRRLAWRVRQGGKRCSRCGEVRPVSGFARDASRPDGLDHRCRSCRSTPRQAD